MQSANLMKDSSWQLPSQWSFKNVAIGTLRRFWTALWLVGMTKFGTGFVALQEEEPTWKPTLWVRTSDLALGIAKLADLTESESRKLLEWHVYDRRQRKSDVALAPLVETGPGYVITSPELVSTSRFERNFYANVARTHGAEVDRMSHLLAPHMAMELAAEFQARGYRTAQQVPYASSRGQGDIDLLVWAPDEDTCVALELKWFVAPADYREVLNLAEKTAESLRTQLPKYQCALVEDAPGVFRRAFGIESAVRPRRWSVGLAARNYAGHASLRQQSFWFVPEAALMRVLKAADTLGGLIDQLEQFSWLPRLGKDYEVHTTEFVSPGGIRLGVPVCRIPSSKPV
jgi:hypothetical protein